MTIMIIFVFICSIICISKSTTLPLPWENTSMSDLCENEIFLSVMIAIFLAFVSFVLMAFQVLSFQVLFLKVLSFQVLLLQVLSFQVLLFHVLSFYVLLFLVLSLQVL